LNSTPSTHERTARAAGGGARRRLAAAVIGLALACAACELVARALTRVEDGRERLLGVPLVPLLPDEDELAALIAAVPPRDAPGAYFLEDDELGWTLGPSANTGIYTSNSQGLRSAPERVYPSAKPTDRTRLITFGDSFTHGDEVELAQAWQTQLEALAPQLEALNFGVPAYGLDQAYLRAKRELPRFEAHYALLCIWPEDLGRALNVYRFLMTSGAEYMQKPRLTLDARGALELRVDDWVGSRRLLLEALARPDALAGRLLEFERWRQPGDLERPAWFALRSLRALASLQRKLRARELRRATALDLDDEAVRLSSAIARAFADAARASGAEPVIVLLPQREFLASHPGGERALPIVARLRAEGLRVVDVSPAFAAGAQSELFLPSGHYTAAGNAAVARALAAEFAPR